MTVLPEADWTILSAAGVGLVFGLKHALDADHLAAVSVIVSQRRSLWGSSIVGALWGLGHTLALLLAAVAVIVLQVEISGRLALGLELLVALMLIGMGLNALRLLRRGATLHMHAHRHGGRVHVHPHLHTHAAQSGADATAGEVPGEPTHHGLRFGARSFAVGLVHGVAGSAALMLLVLSALPSPGLGFIYVGAFGLGSTGGMALMSLLLGLPLHLTAQRFGSAHQAVRYAAALCSVGIGIVVAYEVVVVERLLQ